MKSVAKTVKEMHECEDILTNPLIFGLKLS